MSLHYKKDGSLDMRYSSSKAAMSSGLSGGYSSMSSGLHYKKDGTPDMRYNSSRAATTSVSHVTRPSSSSQLHYKKDGTLDMRYGSSRNIMDNYASRGILSGHRIPSDIPVTRNGLPDMRTAAAKQWVKEQAESCRNDIPSWIPKTKDGSPDTSKAVTQEYFRWKGGSSASCIQDQRLVYYCEKLKDLLFRKCVKDALDEDVEMPQYKLLPETREIQYQLSGRSMRNSSGQHDEYDLRSQISESVPLIHYTDLNINKNKELGKGGFGVVYEGRWKNQTVAVKELYLNRFTRQEQTSFIKEIKIMSILGEHPNLVSLYGYILEPPCLVMELVELGSLSYLLHYCGDPKIEAKITDGRIKKRLIIGTILGMIQLHTVGVVHGDLKPPNVLVTNDYTAKITDFGLATFRGKISSSIASSVLTDDGAIVCGTAAYMAPERLNTSIPPDYSSDVYSFAVLLNEVIQEEEPYTGQYQNFAARGPFGAVNHARLGNRPRIKSQTPTVLRELIQKYWHRDHRTRPSFEQIFKDIQPRHIVFPNSVQL